jgi:S-adenosylmethionine:tRNA ribosyltransferase-isomerase
MSAENPNPELTVRDFDFHLPEELIAQQPPAERGTSRMLVLERESGELSDRHFTDFPSQLKPGDLLVLNDSRVIPARLFGRRANSRGKQDAIGQIEVLLTAPTQEGAWSALVRPGRKVRVGDTLEFPNLANKIVLRAEVLAAGEFGERTLRFEPVEDFYAALEEIGHIPLPPYIHREDALADRERYQTVFAQQRGSVAAPTAGLHFTPEILAEITAKGAEIAKITLHVGLGTFAPLRVEKLSEIHLHRERYTLPAATAEAINRARAEGRRVVAVGTTTVRTLEHVALVANGNRLAPHTGETQIFIQPGHKFRLVDALLTNFHLPQSSLLMLVSAFADRERVLAAYEHAVEQKYRFFSYGDCMFLR